MDLSVEQGVAQGVWRPGEGKKGEPEDGDGRGWAWASTYRNDALEIAIQGIELLKDFFQRL